MEKTRNHWTLFIAGLASISFIACNNVTDVDGNQYKTVTIGQQTWMKENLKVTKYNDGTALVYPGDNNKEWETVPIGMYAWIYNNEAKYKSDYGALYNWYALDKESNGGKNICPKGWHIPLEVEWRILLDYLGGPSIAGNILKTPKPDFWVGQSENLQNLTGFDAVPAGLRWTDGHFNKMNENAYFWTGSGVSETSKAHYFRIGVNSKDVFQNTNDKRIGFSVRCVKD